VEREAHVRDASRAFEGDLDAIMRTMRTEPGIEEPISAGEGLRAS
jgi:hypothetical protein